MKIEKLLLFVSLSLGLISLLSFQWEILPHDWLRLITSGVFFVIALEIIGRKKFLGLLIFLLFVLCDYSLLQWNSIIGRYSYYILHIIVVIFLILLVLRGMKWERISWFEIVSVFFFLLIFSFIFLELREYSDLEGVLLKILFTVNGFLLVFLPALAFFLSINGSNVLSSYFFLGVVSFVVSDLMLFSTYILEIPTFLYIDNIFYVIGFYFLLRASLENKLSNHNQIIKEKEEKERLPNSKSKGFYH